MILFKTTPDQVMRLASIMVEMKATGIDSNFVVAASELARSDQGVFDLMALWAASRDAIERDEIVADIQESIDDYQDAPASPLKKPYIKFDKLDHVARQVVAKKAKLREIIDRHGGVSAVALKTGIPQPSLSRMLNSPSIPRRSTLYRIANALDLPETEIVTEWSR
jgi:DNA invertase Pin-like site-specific DNA recombinase